MLNFKSTPVNLVVCVVSLFAATAHAEGPQDLARDATATQRPHADQDGRARIAAQLGVGFAGVTAVKDRGAEAYLDAALGFVMPSKWGARLGVRLAPGVGSWMDIHGAATYDSFLGRTVLQAGVATFLPFFICFNFSGSSRECVQPSYGGPMVGIQHEFRLISVFGVHTGARAALLDGRPYAMFNFGVGMSL